MPSRPYLSIGEVLGLLLEEFPDITISKIRFLESQGLIDPERTPSGYRKFYDADVERLRVILREQRENFLPLRVIRDRLENGTIEGDPTGGHTPPRGIRNVTVVEQYVEDVRVEFIVPESTLIDNSNHPAAQLRSAAEPAAPELPERGARDSYGSGELCRLAAITAAQLAELESFGLVTGRGSGANTSYSIHDLAIARAAAGFLQRGVEGRHLRAWRQAAEREAALFEQLIVPLIRQRNPQSRQQAVATLEELSAQGGQLRSALLQSALRQYLDD